MDMSNLMKAATREAEAQKRQDAKATPSIFSQAVEQRKAEMQAFEQQAYPEQVEADVVEAKPVEAKPVEEKPKSQSKVGRPKKAEKLKQMPIMLTAKQHRQLKKYAFDNDVSASEVVRQALVAQGIVKE